MNKAYILIGGNLGNRLENLDKAVQHIVLECGPLIIASSIYETEAWGYKEQPAFLNQALLINSNLSAIQLMEQLLLIEKKLGRVRTNPLGPRTIDLDIIYFNEEVIKSENLTIPHPRLAERNFVLMPLTEIAPHFIHPLLHKTNTELMNECLDLSFVYKKTTA